jgi:diguanylate cyclase (GGDEF)-like protein
VIDLQSLEQLRCLLLEVDRSGMIIDAVGGLDKVAGSDGADFVGTHLVDVIAPSDREIITQVVLPDGAQAPINRRPVPFELTLIGRDGEAERVDVLPTAFDRASGRGWIVSVTPIRLRSPAHRLIDVVLGGHDPRRVAEELVIDAAVDATDDPEQSSFEAFVVIRSGDALREVVSRGRHPAIAHALVDDETHRTFLAGRRPRAIHSTLTADLGGPLASACAEAGFHAAHIAGASGGEDVVWWVVWLIDDPAFAIKLLNADVPRLAVMRVVEHALERDRVERVLREASVTDSLTGLQNRRAFIEQSETVATSAGDVVLFLDLDKFKAVNDDHGHHVGDAVLAEIGQRISAVCGSDASGARIGGDEFVVLMRGASPDSVDSIMSRLDDAISAPIDTSAGPISIRATIGVARATDGMDLTGLMLQADMAMLSKKRAR